MFQRTSKPPAAAASRRSAKERDGVPASQPAPSAALPIPGFDLQKVLKVPRDGIVQPNGNFRSEPKLPPPAFLDPARRRADDPGPYRRPEPGQNRTGVPDWLKARLEALSGVALDDVRVHRDSPEPAGVRANAFARGSEIHLGPGQERHLPHEAWHVVQQKQGRVRANGEVGGSPLNDNAHLEREATLMGGRAGGAAGPLGAVPTALVSGPHLAHVMQRSESDDEIESGSGDPLDLEEEANLSAFDEGPRKPGKEEEGVDDAPTDDVGDNVSGSGPDKKRAWDDDSDSDDEDISKFKSKKPKRKKASSDESDEAYSTQSDQSEPDEEYDSKNTKPNPGANFKNTPLKPQKFTSEFGTTGEKYSYDTKDGANYSETRAPIDDNTSIHHGMTQYNTVTTGLRYANGLRNDQKPIGHKVYKIRSHYKRSPGQLGQLAMPFAHLAPAQGGMNGGGDYRNGYHTSQVRNRATIEFDRNLPKKSTYRYETKSVMGSWKDLKDKHLPEIAALSVNPKWDQKRISDHLDFLHRKYPQQQVALEEKRRFGTGDKLSNAWTTFGPDLHAALPPRAYNEEARRRYSDVRTAAKRTNAGSDGLIESSGDESEHEEAENLSKYTSGKYEFQKSKKRKKKRKKKDDKSA